MRWWLSYQYFRGKVSKLLVYWHSSRVGPRHYSLSRLQRHQLGMLVNNVSAACLSVLGEGHEARSIDQCILCMLWDHYICMCVWLCTRGILYYRPQHPIFILSPLLSNETPTLFLHQAYLAQPFILARSCVWQKETSAQWENALIIHDHLTIQDLVCAAYVVFLISACQPHLLMAVSLLLFCILYI